MAGVDVKEKLEQNRQKNEKAADQVLEEVNRILSDDLYNEKNVLANLKHYAQLAELIDENDVEKERIFSLKDIRNVALQCRLRFLGSQCYKFNFPYEVVSKIEQLNKKHHKNLKGFKVLSTAGFFTSEKNTDSALLFAPTAYGNYYLVHSWGKELKWYRPYVNWPLRNIENLFITLLVSTLIITLSLPTYLITLDRKATYWCPYRIGIFFHLLIFNMGVTAYVTFAFSKNLGTSIWDQEKSFG